MSGEPVSVRAGIVVTGTEVLTGRITDRNGPWVSERLGELGVEVAHMTCVGDRADDLEAALRFLARRRHGPDRHHRRPRADRRRHHRRDRRRASPAARWSSTRRWRSGSPRSSPGFARRMKFDPEGLRDGTRKQAMVPGGLDRARPGRHRSRAGRRGRRAGRGRPARARRASCRRCGRRRVARRAGRRPCSTGADSFADGLDEDVRDPRVDARQEPARDRGATIDLERARDHDLPAPRRRARDRRPLPRDRDELLEALFAGLRERHGSFIYTERGESIDELVAGAARRAHDRARRSPARAASSPPG